MKDTPDHGAHSLRMRGLGIAAGFGLGAPEYIGAGLAFIGFLCGVAMLGLSHRSAAPAKALPARPALTRSG
jgi:hypothetical protein